ncbi:MAG: hypothetical protein EOO38_04350 [Cytophagaceae bacterium]|nr:MAG: hypothetical protein EOO38_04350 [Cytophagaceae bacterium]
MGVTEVIVLLLFRMNFRTTSIILVAIPLSLLVSVIIFRTLGLSINTMTLGGLAIASRKLVDEAIVEVENGEIKACPWIVSPILNHSKRMVSAHEQPYQALCKLAAPRKDV